MTGDATRPGDLGLLRQAGRNLRARGGFPVVFGGLLTGQRIRVTTTSGAATPRLTTIAVTPGRGLGGRSWASGAPEAVPDYARAAGITHEFDPQILGEGIVGLAVAPIIVRDRVAGLLYAGDRAGRHRAGDLELLGREADRIARELLVRDLVDERVTALRGRGGLLAGGGNPDLGDLFARLRLLAARTTDARTAAELGELLDTWPAAQQDGPQDGQLTARQVDVLALVALGLTNEQVATSLGLSALTVKSYLRAAMTRLDAQTRYQAVVAARRLGLLP